MKFWANKSNLNICSGSGTPNEVIEFIFEEWDGGESDEADNCISVEEFSAWVEDIKQSASEGTLASQISVRSHLFFFDLLGTGFHLI